MKLHHSNHSLIFAVLLPLAVLAPSAVAQRQPSAPVLPSRLAVVHVDSGPLARPPLVPGAGGAGGGGGGGGGGPAVVYSTLVRVEGARWVRLIFDALELPGDVGLDSAATLRITSTLDGAVQVLDAQSAAQWARTSAYFNGPEVLLEVLASPTPPAPASTPASWTGAPIRVTISQVLASDEPLLEVQDLCGVDNRALITDNRLGRIFGFGGGIGTGFAINDTNRFFLTAGHVQPATGSVITFNNPPSLPDGSVVVPPPADQYAIDPASVQRQTGTGTDWCYFGVFSNSTTGLQPAQAYSAGNFTLAAAAPAVSGQMLRITGFGQTDGFNLPFEQSFVSKTDTGAYLSRGVTINYTVDTTGGNSGSPVLDLSTDRVIGIHTLAGCDFGGNAGTPIEAANLQTALNAPAGVCRTGRGTVAGNLYAIGDQANNFGTVNPVPTRFARIAQLGARWTGMAWDWNRSHFYACDSALGLYEITTGGVMTFAAAITGTVSNEVVGGLAYDPRGRVLYGMAASSGQLYTIDRLSGLATPVGAPQGGTINGLEWDTTRRVLWGIDNAPPRSRLVRIDPVTAGVTVVGNIGPATVSCRDLAFNAVDGNLYTLDGASAVLYRINPATGAGTSLSFTGALFTSVGGTPSPPFGMAYANPRPPCPQDFNSDGVVDPDDLSDFIAGYFSSPPDPRTNFNGDGVIDPDDLSDFIGAYFSAPPC